MANDLAAGGRQSWQVAEHFQVPSTVGQEWLLTWLVKESCGISQPIGGDILNMIAKNSIYKTYIGKNWWQMILMSTARDPRQWSRSGV